MDEEAKTAAAETVQRAVRACVARRALLALRHEAHVTDAARQHDNVPDAAVPHVPPTPPSPQQEETDQGQKEPRQGRGEHGAPPSRETAPHTPRPQCQGPSAHLSEARPVAHAFRRRAREQA